MRRGMRQTGENRLRVRLSILGRPRVRAGQFRGVQKPLTGVRRGTVLPARFAPGRSATPTAAGSTAAPTAKTTRARLPRPSFVHRQGAPAQFRAVQGCDSLIRLRVHSHFYEREAASLPTISVLYDLYFIHLTICGKCCIQILLGLLERNVPYINTLQGALLSRLRRLCLGTAKA
jgi:hypothetical protein